MFKLYFVQAAHVEKMVDEALAHAAENLTQLEHIHEVTAALKTNTHTTHST